MTAMTTTTTPTGGGDEDSYAEDGDPNSQEEYRARVLLSQRTAELMANFKDYVSRDFDGEDDGGNGENDDGLVSLTITGTHDDEDVENGDGDNDAAAVLRGGQGVKGMMVRTENNITYKITGIFYLLLRSRFFLSHHSY